MFSPNYRYNFQNDLNLALYLPTTNEVLAIGYHAKLSKSK